MTNTRDDQFAGAAYGLRQALQGHTPEEQEALIAQFAYALMVHVISNIDTFQLSAYGDDWVIEKIPDMVWPPN